LRDLQEKSLLTKSASKRYTITFKGQETLRLHDAYDACGQFLQARGNQILETWAAFHNKIDEELARLESARETSAIQGREYVYRSSILYFALTLAKIWFTAAGPPGQDQVKAVDEWLERARKL